MNARTLLRTLRPLALSQVRAVPFQLLAPLSLVGQQVTSLPLIAGVRPDSPLH